MITAKKSHLARLVQASSISKSRKLSTYLVVKQNIKEVDACTTRLRVSVKDREKSVPEEAWKRAGAMGLIQKDNGVRRLWTKSRCFKIRY